MNEFLHLFDATLFSKIKIGKLTLKSSIAVKHVTNATLKAGKICHIPNYLNFRTSVLDLFGFRVSNMSLMNTEKAKKSLDSSILG